MSGSDWLGWKHAFLFAPDETGYNSLQITNVSPITGNFDFGPVPIVPEGPRNPVDVTSACNGEVTLLAWIEEGAEEYQLRCGRVMPDLTQLDPDGIYLSRDAEPASIDIAVTEAGGMLGWFDRQGSLWLQRFDETLAPTGDPIFVSQEGSPLHAQVSVSPLGETWLISWSNNGKTPSYGNFSSQGELLGAGIVHLRGGSAYWGLASASSEEMGFITWRSGAWNGVQACRIGLDGEMLDVLPLPVSDFDAFELNHESEFRRNIACAWTGAHFVIYWNTWWVLDPYQRDDLATRDGHCNRDGVDTRWRPQHVDHFSRFESLPIVAQWVTPEGENLYRQPVKTNYGTWKTDVVSVFSGDNAINAIVDEGSDFYIHFVKTDPFGSPISDGSRQFVTNELATKIYGLEGRACADGAVFAWQWDGVEVHEWWTRLTVAQVNDDCEIVHSGSVQISQSSSNVVTENWDVAQVDGDLILVYDRREYGNPNFCIASLIDRRRTLYVDPDGSEAMEPTVCEGDGNFIMAWAEDLGAARRIYFTAFSADDGISEIDGEPLTGPLGSQRQPYLIRGPEHVLCVFVMAVPGTETITDIYGSRIAFDGTLIDTEPILIASMPEKTWHTKGTWNGSNYFVTWTTPDDGPAMYCARVTADGVALDPGGVFICESDNEPGRPTGNAWGHVKLAYGGDQLRLIVDLPGRLVGDGLADGTMPDLDPDRGGDGFRLYQPAPNPSPGAIELAWRNPLLAPVSLEIVNVNGRSVQTINRPGGMETGRFSWDGRLAGGETAPGGVYFVRARGAEGSLARRFVLVR